MTFSCGPATYGMFRLAVQALAFCVFLQATEAKTLQLVALGDSLTAGYGLKAGARFPEVLERELRTAGYGVKVINAGVSGDTAGDGLARFDWSVPLGTDALIVELGANDMLRGLSVEAAKASLSAILAKAAERHIPTLLAGMRAAPNLGPDYGAGFDRIFPDLAAQYGDALYPFFLDGVAADPKLNQPDGLHPNVEGVRIVVAHILPAVEALLGTGR